MQTLSDTYSIKSYAKVNVFLKITGHSDNLHTIASRFVLCENLFDDISFVKKQNTTKTSNKFELIGDFSCKLEQNSIYKAYEILKNYQNKKHHNDLVAFFDEYKIKVDKNIPQFGGLGGGSSNGAYFMILVNDALSLNISKDELAKMSVSIGFDMPFFVYGYKSANVSGKGEIINEYKEPKGFDEFMRAIKITTPNIQCSTPNVYKTYKERFYNPISYKEAEGLFTLSSQELIGKYDKSYLNDLYKSATFLHPKLLEYATENNYFSGSGSSFFEF